MFCPPPLPINGQYAKLIAVIEDGGQIVSDRQVRSVEIARDDRDRIGVEALAGGAEFGLVRQRRAERTRDCEKAGSEETKATSAEKKATAIHGLKGLRNPPIDSSPAAGYANATHTKRDATLR